MKSYILFFSLSFLVFTSSSQAATNAGKGGQGAKPKSAINDKSLIEELTGKKSSQLPSSDSLKNSPLPVQHYFAGEKAAATKNYILAIKHFNTVIQKYPQSGFAAKSFFAKAKVYQQMGLQPQAERNLKLAQLKVKKASGVVSNQEKNKIIK